MMTEESCLRAMSAAGLLIKLRSRLLIWCGIAAMIFSPGVLPAARAHVLDLIRVKVTFDASQTFTVRIAIDLTNIIGSGEDYYALSTMPPDAQAAKLREIAPKLLEQFDFRFGAERVMPELKSWTLPTASRDVFEDYYVGKMTEFVLEGKLPANRPPLTFAGHEPGMIEYPLAYTFERPDRGIQITRFLEIDTETSDPFDYDQPAPAGAKATAAGPAAGPAASGATGAVLSGAELSPARRFWTVQGATLWRYLKLGFHHIVPEGTDHILFVLGLFFLGISWRKLLSQTTVFTVAHATTLYLSSRGIFTLPSWLVEPGIALSIAFIAFENIFKPKLSVGRLFIVFFFGLIHGLGFASGLKELALPPREFLVGLLGFNFGVDFGQLFIILVAFLLVGWFRKRPWYFSRIAVPASAVIALTGVFWAIQRIIFYARLA